MGDVKVRKIQNGWVVSALAYADNREKFAKTDEELIQAIKELE